MLADLPALRPDALARDLPRAVGLLQDLPGVVTVALLVAGVALLVAGARWRRPIAVLGGLVAGALAGFALQGVAAQARISADSAIAAGAAGVALLAAVFPPIFPLVLGSVLGAVAGVRLPLGHPAVGAAVGAVGVAAAATLGARGLAAILAGLLGGALTVAGALGLARAIPGGEWLVKYPLLAAALALVLGIAGAALQLDSAWGGPRAAGGKGKRSRLEPPRPPPAADEE